MDFCLFALVQRSVFSLEGAQRIARGAGGRVRPLDAVVEQRGGLKLIKNKNQYAEEQDAKLHRDFEERIEHQAESAIA